MTKNEEIIKMIEDLIVQTDNDAVTWACRSSQYNNCYTLIHNGIYFTVNNHDHPDCQADDYYLYNTVDIDMRIRLQRAVVANYERRLVSTYREGSEQ